jgi:hypothetical protein
VGGEIPPAIGDFPAGSQIASYRIEQLIGRGGMAVVYRATDVRLDRLVALKILAPELARDEAFRQRFIRESRSGAAVDHPNVIPVFEAGEADGVLFIAMRYVTGSDVRGLIDRQGKLPPGRVVSIISQVASALDAAHANGLIHRDVKPANMLLGTVGSGRSPDHVYLSDFGLSKLSVSQASLTGTGQFLGTLDYMSPEQIEGRPVDGRTDLYALGCTAFEMLTGEPPFRREQNLAVMWAQVSAQPPSVRQLCPELPAEVDVVIARALAKSPENRQASCLEFASELRSACMVRPSAPGQPVLPPQPARPATELAAFGSGAGAAGMPPVAGGAGMPPVAGFGTGAVAGAAAGAAAGMAAAGFDATVTEGAAGQPIAPGALGRPTAAAAGPGGATAVDPRAAASGGVGQQLWRDAPGGGHPSYPGEPGYGGPSGFGGPPGYPGQQPGPPRRRGKALPVLLGLLVVVVLIGAAVLVLKLRGNGNPSAGPTNTQTVTVTPSNHPTSPATSPATQSASSPATSPGVPVTASPAAVVKAYFRDINNHHYHRAYVINAHIHDTQTYAQFRSGYADTSYDVVTITGVSGDVVSVQLAAHQDNGSIQNFSGTYTVQGNRIVGSAIS